MAITKRKKKSSYDLVTVAHACAAVAVLVCVAYVISLDARTLHQQTAAAPSFVADTAALSIEAAVELAILPFEFLTNTMTDVLVAVDVWGYTGTGVAGLTTLPVALAEEALTNVFVTIGVGQEVLTAQTAAATPQKPIYLMRLSRWYIQESNVTERFDSPVDPGNSAVREKGLGYLSGIQGTSMVPLYSCEFKYGNAYGYNLREAMTTKNAKCEGTGGKSTMMGYVWTAPAPGLIPIYRCLRNYTVTYYGIVNVRIMDHFSSKDKNCEGAGITENNGKPYFYLSDDARLPVASTFSANPTHIEVGQRSTLRWSTTNTLNCGVLLRNQPLGSGLSGSTEVGPFPTASDLSFELKCAGITVDQNGQPTYMFSTTTTLRVRPANTPLVTIVATDPEATETGGFGRYTISRDSYLTNALRVNVLVDGKFNDQSFKNEYTLSGSIDDAGTYVTIPAGAASAAVRILPVSDLIDESDEYATLAIAPGNEYGPGAQNSATIKIIDAPKVGGKITDPSSGEKVNIGGKLKIRWEITSMSRFPAGWKACAYIVRESDGAKLPFPEGRNCIAPPAQYSQTQNLANAAVEAVVPGSYTPDNYKARVEVTSLENENTPVVGLFEKSFILRVRP